MSGCSNMSSWKLSSDNKVLHGTSKSSGSPLFFHSMTISWVYGIPYFQTHPVLTEVWTQSAMSFLFLTGA